MSRSTSTADTYPLERWQQTIAEGFAGTRGLDDASLRGAVEGAVAALDAGDVRVASPPASAGGEWVTHAWLKQAILLYFRMHVSSAATRRRHRVLRQGFRPSGTSNPPACAWCRPAWRAYGSFLEKNVILMPGYVNIGAARR
jgi:2,3,4,5-tetrahydropyridine-2-carboxylate N-succinyltransferase